MSALLTEFELIKEIKKRLTYGKDVIKGIGDDCAVIKKNGVYQLYTIDNMVENVHFDFKIQKKFENIGFKAVSRAISDIVAMGGTPKFILVSLAISKSLDETGFHKIATGIKTACKYYKTDLIGGDITKSAATTVTVAVIGECNTKPILRSGATIGDNIYVTGSLGLAAAGLALLKAKKEAPKKLVDAYEKPVVQVALGNALREKNIATSMIDISDGLLGDLNHILEESKKGAVLELKSLPISKLLKSTFSKKDYTQFILNGGDDYQLLFTANEGQDSQISLISKQFKTPITKIGKIIKNGFFMAENDKVTEITPNSYQHSFTFY